MANTFSQAQGIPVGASRVESEKVDLRMNFSIGEEETRVEILLQLRLGQAEEISRRRAHSKHGAALATTRDAATAGKSASCLDLAIAAATRLRYLQEDS